MRIVALFPALSILLSASPPAYAGDVTVSGTITGLEGGSLVHIAVMNQAEWESDDPAIPPSRGISIENEGSSLRYSLQVPPGEYAVVVFEDEDGDLELTKNFLGIPKESFGFSRNFNPFRHFGPPSFDEISISFEQDERVDIELIG